MARYTGAVCRLCRREGQKLFLKGDRCYTPKCSISRRDYAPGQHGQGRKKISEFGLQMRAKQKAKRYYGVLENQFRKYFDLAATEKEGRKGENLLANLERRLDNVVYRLGWANSRAQARQMVLHRNFCVNGERVNIPSFLVNGGDVISIFENSRSKPILKSMLEKKNSGNVPKWLEKSSEGWEAKVVAKPAREDIDLEVEETLIVELYSK